MRFAPVLTTLSLLSIGLAVACTGGPGSIEQGSDNGDQYGGVTKDPSGGDVAADLSSGGLDQSSSSGKSSQGGTNPKVYEPQPDLKASEYDQSCNSDSDCQQVYEGTVCTPCVYACRNAAISEKDYAKWSSDRTNRSVKCDPATISGSCSSCDSSGKQAYCDASKRCVYGVKPG